MRSHRHGLLVATFLGLCVSTPAVAGSPVEVLFMEPRGNEDTAALPTYRLVEEPERIAAYTRWMENESARWALDSYVRAWGVHNRRQGRGDIPAYPIALVPGGNHAAIGFRLESAAGVSEYPSRPYIKLEAEDWRFGNTFLHETGHVVLATLSGGNELIRREPASIPHTTASLTDRVTAFDEGFAIHLETLLAHLGSEREIREKYHRERIEFGRSPVRASEYYRHASDLLSFSQTVARYSEVRENNFSFAPAFSGPDYVRVQMEKARDFATPRDANQLLQSEGFHASCFFSLCARGEGKPTVD